MSFVYLQAPGRCLKGTNIEAEKQWREQEAIEQERAVNSQANKVKEVSDLFVSRIELSSFKQLYGYL